MKMNTTNNLLGLDRLFTKSILRSSTRQETLPIKWKMLHPGCSDEFVHDSTNLYKQYTTIADSLSAQKF